MQRPPSFVLLDPDSSSSEHEDIVEIPYDASKELSFSSEEVVFDVPLTFNKGHIKIDSKIEAPFPSENIPSKSSKDQDSCPTPNDECVDIVEPLSTQSAKFSDASTKSSLLSEEIVVDAPQVSGRGNSGSDLIISDSSGFFRPEDGAQMELSKDITENEPEVDQDAPSTTESDERTTAGNIAARAGGQPEDSDGVAPNDSPVANFYLHIVDLIEKISEITGHIDNTSKLIALCVVIAAVLIPATTICLLPTSKSSAKSDFAPPPAVDLDGSSELMKCRSVLNWRQEKVEQIETKLEKLKSSLRELQNSYNECGRSLSEHQEKYAKCGASLKETKKQLKSRDDLYESCRSKLLELQEKIIDRQQDLVKNCFRHKEKESSDCRPFYQKAFDKIFGHHTGHKFRERRSKWKN